MALMELAGTGVVLVGNPNVGKSALFGALTGTYTTVSNYPGTTVEVARAWATLEDVRVSVLDTPGAASFVEGGDRVKKDQVLCIIEAMKLMNEITSEYDGEIVSAYVENGKPVQYGERLFAIRTT